MPSFDDGHYNLGRALAELGQMEAAAGHFGKAAELNPNVADTHYNLGIVFKELGNLADAESSYLKTLSIDPKFANAYINLAVLQRGRGKLDEAAANFRQALAITPDLPEAHGNLGNVLQDLGQLDEAIVNYRRALQLKPSLHNIHSNMLLAYQYQLGQNSESLMRLHREWNDAHASPFRSRWPRVYGNSNTVDRRIRVGFVSSDLKRHPVGYFVSGLFENTPPDEIESFVYFSGVADDLTDAIKPAVDIWRDVRDVSDDDLSKRIADDEIDILFDLSGHSAGNRALVFSRKPAPVQVSWAGYVSNTGQDSMDYFLSDAYSTPEHEEKYYCEKVIRMPDGWLCYTLPEYSPDIGPAPFKRNGFITFGSFSNPAKINIEVIRLWSSILKRVGDERLLVKYRGIDSETNRKRLFALFEEHGVGSDRLILEGRSPHSELLGRYNSVDITLDPFPYSGGLTTYESLWMEVPVITRGGDTFASRHSVSHLSVTGLQQFIADSLENYVEIAVGLVNAPETLEPLRRELRATMALSPICDSAKFAQGFSTLMRRIWSDWCRSAHP